MRRIVLLLAAAAAGPAWAGVGFGVAGAVQEQVNALEEKAEEREAAERKASSPSAQAQGTVYFRDAATSYPLAADVSGAGAAFADVVSGGTSAVSDAAGRYVLVTSTGHRSLEASRPGSISVWVSSRAANGDVQNLNLGLFPAPAAVTARPGFVKGIIHWDAGGWITDLVVPNGEFLSTQARIQARTGANLAAFPDGILITSATPASVVMSTAHPNEPPGLGGMMSEPMYADVVADAHARGLEFMMWVFTHSLVPEFWDIVYAPGARDPAFWDSWFSEYQRIAVEYAGIAQRRGVEYFSLGHDTSYATSASRFASEADCLARWTALVQAVRAVYGGKVVYFGYANPNASPPSHEHQGYPAGFISLFDAVGVNVQDIHPSFNPTRDQLKAAWTSFLDGLSGWNRPVFVMVRTPSVDGGTSFDTYIEPGPAAANDDEADNHAANPFQQADLYQALFEAVNGTPTGDGRVMGVLSWGYHFRNEHLIVEEKGVWGRMAHDKSASIRGKPAEAVCRHWFERF